MIAWALLLSLAAAPERDEAVVPAVLQAELLARVLRYDRAFAASQPATVAVLIVHREGAASEAFARQLQAALRGEPRVGGLAHDEALFAFTTVERLVQELSRTGARVVIFAPGFAEQSAAIAAALDGKPVLSISSTPRGVSEGLVLGFDLVEGKPRMLFNLLASRRQQADFRAEVIKLMTVVP